MTDKRVPQLPGIDPRDYAIDFTANSDSSTAYEQFLRDLMQYTVTGTAVGQSARMPQGKIATTRPILVPLTQTDTDSTDTYYVGAARMLDHSGCRIVPNFSAGDVVEFFIPQTLLSANVSISDTQMHVFTTTYFPTTYPFKVMVGSETITVNSLASAGVWNINAATATHAKYAAVSQKVSTGWLDINGFSIDGTNAPTTNFTALLDGAIDNSQTSITVKSVSGTVPTDRRFTITVDAGTASEEKMLVTSGSDGLNWGVTRNYGGLSAFSHSDGAAVARYSTLVKFNGGTVNGGFIHKLALNSLNLQHFSGNGVVLEGAIFENAIRPKHIFAHPSNTVGAGILLQSLGASSTNTGVSSIDVFGGTVTGAKNCIKVIETDVKVFGGTYLSAYQEAVYVSSAFESAFYGVHFENNYTSGVAGTAGNDWPGASTSQAAIYMIGGGTISGCSGHWGTGKTQRYLVRCFNTGSRPLTIIGGSTTPGATAAASQLEYYLRAEGTSAGRFVLVGTAAGGGGSRWVDGSSGAVKVTEINTTNVDGIAIDGASSFLTAPVANSSLANMTAKTVKMRHTNSTGAPEDTTMANLWTDLSGQAGANVDMNSKKFTSLPIGSNSGEAMVVSLNDISQLAAASGNYNMGAFKFTGLGAGGSQTDSVRYDQLVDPLAVALGLKNWNFNPAVGATSTAPTSQTIYAMAIWLPNGLSITGVILSVVTPAAGNKPTSFTVGIASDNAGTRTMRAQSNDLSGNSGAPFATSGATQCAFSGAYTTSAVHSPNGLYYIVLLQNGSYGSTQPTFTRNTGATPSTTALLYATGGTGQTAFPSTSSTITLATTGTPLAYCVGAY